MNEKQYTPFCDRYGKQIAVGDHLKVTNNYITGAVTSIGTVRYSEEYKDYIVDNFDTGWAGRFLSNEHFNAEIVEAKGNNMEKSVVWISDSVNVMKEVAAYVFTKLWERDIKSCVFLTETSENSVTELNKAIYDSFVCYVANEECNMDEFAKAKEKLVTTAEGLAPIADVVFDKSNIINNDIEFEAQNEALISKIVSELTSGYNEDTWYGVELCLCGNDYSMLRDAEINNGEKYPILSMALYNALKRKGYKVFLFTKFIAPNITANSWKKIYGEFFSSDENIIIYHRKGKSVGSTEDDLIKLICEGDNER